MKSFNLVLLNKQIFYYFIQKQCTVCYPSFYEASNKLFHNYLISFTTGLFFVILGDHKFTRPIFK